MLVLEFFVLFSIFLNFSYKGRKEGRKKNEGGRKEEGREGGKEEEGRKEGGKVGEGRLGR